MPHAESKRDFNRDFDVVTGPSPLLRKPPVTVPIPVPQSAAMPAPPSRPRPASGKQAR